MLKFAKRQLLRLIYSAGIRQGLTRSLASFLPLWAASDTIYIGPAGPSATIYPEASALRQVIASAAIPDAQLYELLSHRSPWVVGYGLEALLARRSPRLSILPASLQGRAEPVCMGLGCVLSVVPLGDYVLHRFQNTFHRDPEYGQVA